MKTIILMRHAKAEIGNFDTLDFDRKLAEKGKTDAEKAGKVLQKQYPQLDLIVASSAKRTFKTAKIVAEGFGIDKKHIEAISELYEAEAHEYTRVIRSLDDLKHKTVLIIGHNPTIGAMASVLSGYQVNEFKPGSFAVFQVPIETWKIYQLVEAKILNQFTP